jgi:hypothetical protein
MSIIFQHSALGMNSATAPKLLSEGTLAMLVNGSVTTGFCRPRPPFIEHEVAVLDTASSNVFGKGKVQGVGFYRDEQGDALTVAVDGRLFRLDLERDTLERIGTRAYFAKSAERVEFCQRDVYHIAQDGISPPVVIRHKTATQGTHPTRGIPVGSLMAEGWGRLAVARGDKVFFSNHISDPNTEDVPAGVEPALAFTEDTAYFLNTRFFRVPKSSGKIVGMTFTPSLNGDGDLGPLAVFCERSTWLYNTRVPREQWGSQDIASNPLPRIGACASGGIVVRGNDVLFSDQTGRIQQMRIAVRRNDDARLKSYDSAVFPLFENDHKTSLHKRLSVHLPEWHTLTAIHPEPFALNDGRMTTRHRSLLALNESPAVEGAQAIWDGVWNGVFPVAMIVAPWRGAETIFIISLDSDGTNRIYRLGKTGQDTVNATPKGQPMMITTRAVSDEQPFKLKQAISSSIHIGEAAGNVSVQAAWVTDGGQALPWFGKRFFIPTHFDGGFGAEQGMPRTLTPVPPGQPFSYAQCQLTVVGQATVEEIAIDTQPLDSPSNNVSNCSADHKTKVIPVCEDALRYDLYLSPPFDCTPQPYGTQPQPQPIRLPALIGLQLPQPGRPGKDGSPGTQWRSGEGEPLYTLGKDGDYYLNTATGDILRREDSAYVLVFNVGSTTPISPTITGITIATDGSLEITTSTETLYVPLFNRPPTP